MRIVAISDTYYRHTQIDIPDGDIFIHAGDITEEGLLLELSEFNKWIGQLPHKHKIVIAGDRDHCFQRKGMIARSILSNACYLEDESLTIEDIKIYGSPWQPRFHNGAFNLDRGAQIAEKWSLIPADNNLLITHGPPFSHGDLTLAGHYVGCQELLSKVEEIKPRLHIFGHIPEDAGISFNADTAFINAAICDRNFRSINKPQIFNL